MTYEAVVSNGSTTVVSGPISSCLNDDWIVEPKERKITLSVGEVEKVSFTAVPKIGTVENGLYPVHVKFRGLHAVGVFHCKVDTPEWNKVRPLWEWWNPQKTELWTAEAREEDEWRKAEMQAVRSPVAKFALAEGVKAFVAPGEQGLTDGVIVFSDGSRTFAYRGFAVVVSGEAVGATEGGRRKFSKVVTGHGAGGRLEVLHTLKMMTGDELILRATLFNENGVLRLKWDMPGAVRSVDGTPRYTALYIGPGTEKPARIYFGMGQVLERPGDLDLRADGTKLATRHVGTDYESGLSVVQATDVFPDYFIVRAGSCRSQLVAHHDATFTFAVSKKGAFTAAKQYAAVSGFRRSPGYGNCARKICLDDWGGPFSNLTESVKAYASYGVTNAVLIKHDWSRWGYDNRLPDFHPARAECGGPAGLKALSRQARACGMSFGVHENYIDFYPDADGFTYDAIMHNSQSGRPLWAWFNKRYGAQSYRACPEAMLPYAERNARFARDGFSPDAIFIDVFSAMQPLDYYDRSGRFHSRMECAELWGRIFDRYRENLGVPDAVTVSEAGTDVLIGHLDAGQCDHHGVRGFVAAGSCVDGERIPWHDIVTHGKFAMMGGGLEVRYGTPYGSDDYLETTAIGGRMPMASGILRRSGVMTDWLLEDWWKCVAKEEMTGFAFEEGNIRRRTARFSNGAIVRSNRDTNSVWNVNGEELPGYGFIAKGPGYQGGVVLKNGQRVGFAKTPGQFFVDARPIFDPPVVEPVSTWVNGIRVTDGNSVSVTVGFRVNRAIKNLRGGFVHVLDDGNQEEGPIRFMGHLNVSVDDMAECGRSVERDFKVTVPDSIPEGLYSIRYGLLVGSSRMSMDGVVDPRGRALGGTLKVEKTDGKISKVSWMPSLSKKEKALEAAKLEGRNVDGRIIDFGGIRTDGAFRLEHSAKVWTLHPLPWSRPFAAEIDLSAFGASGRKVASAPGAVEWRQRGDLVRLRGDGKSIVQFKFH